MQQSTAEMLLFNLAGKKPCDCLLECCISLHVDGEGGGRGKGADQSSFSICSLWWGTRDLLSVLLRQSNNTFLKKLLVFIIYFTFSTGLASTVGHIDIGRT